MTIRQTAMATAFVFVLEGVAAAGTVLTPALELDDTDPDQDFKCFVINKARRTKTDVLIEIVSDAGVCDSTTRDIDAGEIATVTDDCSGVSEDTAYCRVSGRIGPGNVQVSFCVRNEASCRTSVQHR